MSEEEKNEEENGEDNEEEISVEDIRDKASEATDTVRNAAVDVINRSRDHLSRAGKMASKLGMSGFSKDVLVGAVKGHLGEVRKDQLHTVLRNNQSIAELIDEENPPAQLINAIEKLSTFVTRQDMIILIDRAITPQVVKQGLRTADPEIYKMILQGVDDEEQYNTDDPRYNEYNYFSNPGQGEKWFIKQTREVKAKIIRIILKKTFDDIKGTGDVQGLKGLIKLAEETGQNDIAIDIRQYVKAIHG